MALISAVVSSLPMDNLVFDPYASHSDNSAPHTPEPHPPTMVHYKTNVDDAVRTIFDPQSDDNHNAYWVPQSAPLFNNNNNGSRTSLLQELYGTEEQQPATVDVYPDHPSNDAWNFNHSHQQQQQQQQVHQLPTRPNDYQMMRRNTFPVVRYDREDGIAVQQYPPFMSQQAHYQRQEPLGYSEQPSLSAEPLSYQSENYMPRQSAYHDHTNIKLEESNNMIVPPHSFYRPPSSGGLPPMPMSYMSSHPGLNVQHTDDAASKETQYLRRRCFNCHTTEPPSWRRSTLNPGKIVCNKCGLYERTHLRPRPLRFDELRAGNKQRKQSKGTVSPKAKISSIVKKEPREHGLVRRLSVSSASSTHSGSGASDWDDNVSVYSAGSAPPTSFSSPSIQNFPLSRDVSQSPPRDGGIRLPNAPLSDIASLQQQNIHSQSSTPALSPPRNAHSPPGYFSPPAPSPEFFRHSPQWGDMGLKDGANNVLLSSPVPTPVAS